MAKVVISDGAAKGEYELAVGYFTNRELHLIKRETGVRAGELEEAFAAGDNDLLIVLAYIALQRNGLSHIPISSLWDMEAGTITFDFQEDEEVEDENPPQ